MHGDPLTAEAARSLSKKWDAQTLSVVCAHRWEGMQKPNNLSRSLSTSVPSPASLYPFLTWVFVSKEPSTSYWDISCLHKHPWDVLFFFSFRKQRIEQRLLIFSNSNQVYIFLFISIYRVSSESFCIASNFKKVLDINNIRIWDTSSSEESV